MRLRKFLTGNLTGTAINTAWRSSTKKCLLAHFHLTEQAQLGWPPEQLESYLYAQFKGQALEYARRFPGARFDVIEVDAQPVGRFYVARHRDAYVIIDIAVAAAWRRKGIATRLIRDLQNEAGDRGAAIQLQVRADDPARELYARLGFETVAQAGPGIEMRWLG